MIHLFPAWPKDWDAEFVLLARGNFLVRSAIRSGRVVKLELESRVGAECHLRNPWGDAAVTLQRGGKTERMSGEVLRFPTIKGEPIVVTPAT